MTRDGLVVVTDLDGCLLDAATYRWDAARPALGVLAERGIPLVLCSSKTRAEMQPLHGALALDAPYVFENGGGFVVPPGTPWSQAAGHDGSGLVPLGTPIDELARALVEIARETGAQLVGFSRLSLGEVRELTGLGEADAALARQREYDEPFLLEDGDERRVREAAERRGLRVTKGGRFHHLTGPIDKGQALRRVLALRAALTSIGLGDAENDLPLLGAVDRPILVPRPDGRIDPALLAAFPAVQRAPGPGPGGWSQAVLLAVDAPQPSHAQVAGR